MVALRCTPESWERRMGKDKREGGLGMQQHHTYLYGKRGCQGGTMMSSEVKTNNWHLHCEYKNWNYPPLPLLREAFFERKKIRLARMVWGTYFQTKDVPKGSIWWDFKACLDDFRHFFYRWNGDLTKLLQSAKKSACLNVGRRLFEQYKKTFVHISNLKANKDYLEWMMMQA